MLCSVPYANRQCNISVIFLAVMCFGFAVYSFYSYVYHSQCSVHCTCTCTGRKERHQLGYDLSSAEDLLVWAQCTTLRAGKSV